MTAELTVGTQGAGPGRRAASPAGPAAVLAALDGVRDPELDEPVTALGFVSGASLSADGQAEVRLRLPTYFCAPNFAFLMVADAYDAVTALPGVHSARVVLEDHFASDAINGGVAARAGFAQSFDGEAVGELDGLRADFLRKAVMAGTDQVCRPLARAGAAPEALARMTLGEVPPSPALARLRQRRAELGLPAGDDAPLLLDPVTGQPLRTEAVPLHLRRAHTTAVSLDANSGICRGMLAHRYAGTAGLGQRDPDRPVLGQPVLDQPVLDQPVLGQPALDQPVLGRPVLDQPALDQQARAEEDQ
jgi:metal-sulfur cluster biosynthetic enzyme